MCRSISCAAAAHVHAARTVNARTSDARPPSAPVDGLQGGDGLRLLGLVLQRAQPDDAVLLALQVRLVEQLRARRRGHERNERRCDAVEELGQNRVRIVWKCQVVRRISMQRTLWLRGPAFVHCSCLEIAVITSMATDPVSVKSTELLTCTSALSVRTKAASVSLSA